jgi:hypothetical protein
LEQDLSGSEYEAKTRLERAYILSQPGRGAELGPVTREARERLLAGRPARHPARRLSTGATVV